MRRGVIGGFLTAAVLMTCAGSANGAVTNGRIAFEAVRSGAGFDVVTVKPDGKGWTDLTPGSHPDYCAPAWSPDGTQIAFVEPRPQLPGGVDPGNGYVHVMNADGSGDRVLTLARTLHECTSPTWSADGSYIAYGGFDGSNFERVYAIPSNGVGAPMPVTESDVPTTNPSWSTDGTQIAYDAMDGSGIHTIPVTRGPAGLSFGPPHRVGGVGVDPDWSPDGARFAVASFSDPRGIWTIGSSDGSDPQQVTSGSVDGAPSWSPDGAAIAFDGTSPSGYTEIFTVASDGSGTPVQVTVSGAHSFVFAAQPDWQRRGH